jgi:hypothetical protein
MFLISGRTADNPGLLSECIEHGCTTIYLEKPGATTVKELEDMKAEAEAANVRLENRGREKGGKGEGFVVFLFPDGNACSITETRAMVYGKPCNRLPNCNTNPLSPSPPPPSVLMGYNKNVCKYVSKVRAFASTHPGSHCTFVSNNTYTPSSLGECFERNSEGMLKNMAIHELALLVSFYDVTVENVEKVQVDEVFTSRQTLKGPSGKDFTDFDKVKVRI